MIVSLLTAIFIFASLILGILVMVQQGKGDMGLGPLSSSTQALFGGSGGQTFFQKLTWILGFIFVFGSLGLTVLKMRQLDTSRIVVAQKAESAVPTQSSEQNEADRAAN